MVFFPLVSRTRGNSERTDKRHYTAVLVCIIALVTNATRVPLSCFNNNTVNGEILYDYQTSIVENGESCLSVFIPHTFVLFII